MTKPETTTIERSAAPQLSEPVTRVNSRMTSGSLPIDGIDLPAEVKDTGELEVVGTHRQDVVSERVETVPCERECGIGHQESAVQTPSVTHS